MPWAVNDVDKHKKGLTSEQKKKWVSVANSVLKDCLAKGGTDKTCAPKAIRIANSKFSEEEKEMKKVPSSACNFTEPEAFLFRDEEKGNVDILAYSGKVIKGHWYWGDLAIDVSGAQFDKKIYGIFEQHDIMRKVGFSSKPITDDNKLTIKNMTFVSTDASKEFQTLSKEGFPFQASISGRPTIVEELEEGESAEVNGYKFKGPGSIWRKWTYNETSVVVFGADGNTKAKALADSNEEVEITIKKSNTSSEGDETHKEDKEVKIVNLKELKEKDEAVFNELLEEAKKLVRPEIEQSFSAQLTTVTTQFTEAQKQIADSSAKILAFEKSEVIRKEKEIKLQADEIWQKALSASEIPEHLFAKVKSHVPYEKFMKDGILSETEFAAAVTAEIADWVKSGVSKSVLGTGFTVKGAEEVNEQKEDDNWIKKMQTLAGGTQSPAATT